MWARRSLFSSESDYLTHFRSLGVALSAKMIIKSALLTINRLIYKFRLDARSVRLHQFPIASGGVTLVHCVKLQKPEGVDFKHTSIPEIYKWSTVKALVLYLCYVFNTYI